MLANDVMVDSPVSALELTLFAFRRLLIVEEAQSDKHTMPHHVNVAQDVAVAFHCLKFHCCHFTAFTHVSYNFTSFYINSFNNILLIFWNVFLLYVHYLQNGTFLFMQQTCQGKHSLNA